MRSVGVKGDEHDTKRGEQTAEENRTVVQSHLARILLSPSFQGTKRCQEFLKYTVDHALTGDFDALKERVIGVNVFGRPAGFETSGDSIVRVKANEVRKRLAQYYQESGAEEPLHIKLPAGSYVPLFVWQGEKVIPPESGTAENTTLSAAVESAGKAATPRGRIFITAWAAVGLCVVVASLIIWRQLSPPPTELDRFWAPLLAPPGSVVACIPARDDYRLPPRLNQFLREAAKGDSDRLDMQLQQNEVAVVPDAVMSLQNFRAILSLASFLTEHGKQAQFRTASEISADEIRHQGVILIGAYYNPWAMQINQELRYRFESTNQAENHEVTWISDRKAPNVRKWEVNKTWPYHPQPVDYAIVSRLFDSANGRVILSAAGMNSFGTQVTGEFLTEPQYLKSASPLLPKGWEHQNCQFILETKVVGTTPGPPKVLAVHCW